MSLKPDFFHFTPIIQEKNSLTSSVANDADISMEIATAAPLVIVVVVDFVAIKVLRRPRSCCTTIQSFSWYLHFYINKLICAYRCGQDSILPKTIKYYEIT
jgi:hypothetical protein